MLLKGLMAELWGMIDALQMVVFIPLVPLPFPASAQGVFNILIEVAVFDIAPTDDFYPQIFGLPEQAPEEICDEETEECHFPPATAFEPRTKEFE